MDRRILIGIPAAIIALALVSVVVINADSLLGSDDGSVFLIDFDHQMAGNHVKELVKWGPRMTGSEAELKGAEYIAAQFQDAGLEDVHIEEFQVPMFEVVDAKVSLVEYYNRLKIPRPMGNEVAFEHIKDFVLQGYSGSLNWGDFRDDMNVALIGNGTDPESFTDARGKVCFVQQTADTPGNSDLYFHAYQAGALAIVLQNTWRGKELGYLPMFKTNQNPVNYDQYPDIPFFMVSKDMGDQILDRTNDLGYKLRIDFDVRIGTYPCRVVVGDLKGKSDDGMIIFGAHHDTCYNTIGAVDNTVGPATLIEIARGMAGHTPDSTIRFTTYGGEEEGLFGSTEYYNAHEADFQKNVDLYINFDMAHVDPDTNSFTITTTINSSISRLKDIKKELLKAEPGLEEYEIDVIYDDMKWAASDHWAYVNDGHDAMGGWGSGCIEYHTYKDDLSHLNAESLQIGGRILGSYALMAAT